MKTQNGIRQDVYYDERYDIYRISTSWDSATKSQRWWNTSPLNIFYWFECKFIHIQTKCKEHELNKTLKSEYNKILNMKRKALKVKSL